MARMRRGASEPASAAFPSSTLCRHVCDTRPMRLRHAATWLWTGPGAPWLGVALVLAGTSVPYWWPF
jgi:hypothetical protein